MVRNEEIPAVIQKFLCFSSNGMKVTYDPQHSHAATHLEDTPQLKSLVTEVIAEMDLIDDSIETYVDMGRIIGTSDVVEVDGSDEIVYAVRKNRDDDGRVPFTKSRPAQPCPYVTVVLERQNDMSYELLSAWIGTYSDDDEPFPESPNATERSVNFWHKYAFVWGSQKIVPGSLLLDCPWRQPNSS